MIDISNQKWDFSKEEKIVIKWFDENGFDVKLEKQYVGKTIFLIEKDGLQDVFELPKGVVIKNMIGRMEQHKKNFALLKELKKLREQANG